VTRKECLRGAVLRTGPEVRQDLAQITADGRIQSVIAVLWKQREEAVLAMAAPDKNTTSIMQASAIARVAMVTELIDDLLHQSGLFDPAPVNQDPRS
jgi:hypothetical protein